jgi:hypothetical protein
MTSVSINCFDSKPLPLRTANDSGSKIFLKKLLDRADARRAVPRFGQAVDKGLQVTGFVDENRQPPTDGRS